MVCNLIQLVLKSKWHFSYADKESKRKIEISTKEEFIGITDWIQKMVDIFQNTFRNYTKHFMTSLQQSYVNKIYCFIVQIGKFQCYIYSKRKWFGHLLFPSALHSVFLHLQCVPGCSIRLSTFWIPSLHRVGSEHPIPSLQSGIPFRRQIHVLVQSELTNFSPS